MVKELKRQSLLASIGGLYLLLTLDVLAQNKVLPDPTKPPIVPGDEVVVTEDGEVSGAVKLSAIFIQPSSRSAIINNDTVVEGQTWNGMEVVAIHPRKVVLKNESGIQELVLNDIIIKRDAKNEL
jgi:hypothetical protein